jgi:hypothetical protein
MGKLLHLIHVLSILLVDACPEHPASTEVTTILNLQNYSIFLFFPLSALQNDHQQFKSFCGIFSWFEAQFFLDILFFNSSISKVRQNHETAHAST